MNYLVDKTGRRVHVVLAERALGHELPRGAEVHHVNGNRQDNSRGNLVICQDVAYHRLLHARTRVLHAGGNPNLDRFCGRCGALKPQTAFTKTTGRGLCGFACYCKACCAADQRERRARGSRKRDAA